MTLAVKVSVVAGTHVDQAAAEMIALAKQLGQGVKGKFNGTEMFAYKCDSVPEVTKRWDFTRDREQSKGK